MKYDISLAEKLYIEKKYSEEKLRKQILKAAVSGLSKYFSKMDIKSAYITGSLLKKNTFNRFSDIDIAVEGMDKYKYWQVFGDLEEILGTERIDLIELERCRFKEFIYQKGLKIK